jgi:hypothetical protein
LIVGIKPSSLRYGPKGPVFRYGLKNPAGARDNPRAKENRAIRNRHVRNSASHSEDHTLAARGREPKVLTSFQSAAAFESHSSRLWVALTTALKSVSAQLVGRFGDAVPTRVTLTACRKWAVCIGQGLASQGRKGRKISVSRVSAPADGQET